MAWTLDGAGSAREHGKVRGKIILILHVTLGLSSSSTLMVTAESLDYRFYRSQLSVDSRRKVIFVAVVHHHPPSFSSSPLSNHSSSLVHHPKHHHPSFIIRFHYDQHQHRHHSLSLSTIIHQFHYVNPKLKTPTTLGDGREITTKGALLKMVGG